MARERPADADDVLALVAPFMDGKIDAAAFFRVARAPVGPLGWIVYGIRQIARERRSGLGAFTYLAVNGPDVGAFELRWAPLRVHRVIGHWSITALAADRTEPYAIDVTINDQRVELEAAVPGPDATAVIERLTAS